jgi:hypothetical protein
MNGHGGFTYSFRRKWDNPVFRNKCEAGVWAWMCDVAQCGDYTQPTRFGPVHLHRGELLIAERELAEDFNLTRHALRELLQRMADDGMIDLSRDRCPQRAGTVVRISNYHAYQTRAVVQGTTSTANPTANQPKPNRKSTAKRNGESEPDQGVTSGLDEVANRKPTANQPDVDRKPDQEQVVDSNKNTEAEADDAGARAREEVADWEPERPPPDTPPVYRQTDLVSYTVGDRVAEIAGLKGDPNWFGDYGRVEAWLTHGYDPERDIYPAVQRVMARSSGHRIRSLRYFEQAIADQHKARTSPLPEGNLANVHRLQTARAERRDPSCAVLDKYITGGA